MFTLIEAPTLASTVSPHRMTGSNVVAPQYSSADQVLIDAKGHLMHLYPQQHGSASAQGSFWASGRDEMRSDWDQGFCGRGVQQGHGGQRWY